MRQKRVFFCHLVVNFFGISLLFTTKLMHHETIFNFHMNKSVTIIENIRYQK